LIPTNYRAEKRNTTVSQIRSIKPIKQLKTVGRNGPKHQTEPPDTMNCIFPAFKSTYLEVALPTEGALVNSIQYGQVPFGRASPKIASLVKPKQVKLRKLASPGF